MTDIQKRIMGILDTERPLDWYQIKSGMNSDGNFDKELLELVKQGHVRTEQVARPNFRHGIQGYRRVMES